MESLEQKYAQTLENSNLSLKQRQVLLSSLKLFSEIGFENTTASLISKEAGVSEGTVFSYFKTKEGILEAILSTFLEQVIPDVIADFSGKKFTANQESFPLFLRSIVRDRLVFIQKNQMQVKILLSRSFIDKTISDQLGNVIVHSIIKPISPVLNQFKEKGVIRVWSNERIVRYILALSLSYALPMMLNDNEDVNIDETVNEIVECLSFALVEVK
ncbi:MULTISPECIES: TetR/AcrR family transcriptional regulator [Streptococcus]|jgi:transcriptional regulator, tetR family|uniref:TetR/AcrR family transcriptional regulator n=1 Tax=Streptococcus TaxID=1301 RepID=UPI0002584147|nr:MULTISPECIES: TetR/AcrR family transcriptional regulator [Streptococcus]ATF56529.1 TetR/AcrR family transcriptional regulator [Streptococcus oralis]EIC76711.1 transcriptional regulator, TetR family [Streptococcus oralis SK100]KZX05918.1 TetR family transcriptional regulator [Streptococcus oralis]